MGILVLVSWCIDTVVPLEPGSSNRVGWHGEGKTGVEETGRHLWLSHLAGGELLY